MIRRGAVLLAAVASIAVGTSCSDRIGGPELDAAASTTAPLHATEELPDGQHFGFVTALDPARFRLVFDRAELLEGAEASAAAEEEGGVVTEGGFFVRNPDDRMHRLTLDPAIRVRLLVPCCELTEVPFEQWFAGFTPTERAFYGTADSHYWITVTDGRVVAVEEAHLP
ncbi:MAG TPA: hypothetical protein VM262_19145 [Acidimicrobiales bacterium]|nr:hypothetical protein [Acidimicrobiales bacterium]